MFLIQVQWKIVTFPLKNGDRPKRVVDFLLEKTHSENKNHGSLEGFLRKSDNNNGKTLQIVEDFACEGKTRFFHFSPCFFFCEFLFIVLFFLHVSSFFIFLHFSSFSAFLRDEMDT